MLDFASKREGACWAAITLQKLIKKKRHFLAWNLESVGMSVGINKTTKKDGNK